MIKYMFILFLLTASIVSATVPVSHNGRFRPINTITKSEDALWKEHFHNHKETPIIAIPSHRRDGTWYSLENLIDTNQNFSAYSDSLFEEIRNSYLQISLLMKENPKTLPPELEHLKSLLIKGYQPLAGKAYTKAVNKSLHYPSIRQLEAENLLVSYPFVSSALVLYFLSLILLYFRPKLGVYTLLSAFLIHTFILTIRCYILERPPVSNMYETVIYVPWMAVLLSIIFYPFKKSSILLYASALLSVILLALIDITQMNRSMENVQAVLDSQYWLIIHVLLVVGSYGAFLLSGILAHIYLIFRNISHTLILQTMYVGTVMLISGTILGGVWAAQSWGRFWDWDPKESWAFISCAIYLLWIHAYRFGYIRSFGLAMGAIIGLLTITFTWYGVNYILGTGLHSYGFGGGGEWFYAIFILAELLFCTIMLLLRKQKLLQ